MSYVLLAARLVDMYNFIIHQVDLVCFCKFVLDKYIWLSPHDKKGHNSR